MSSTSTWSPIDGAAAVTFAQIEDAGNIALVTDTDTAAQFALQTLAAGEAVVRAMRVRPIELTFAPYFSAIVGVNAAAAFGAVAPTTIDPVFGGGENAVRAVERDAGRVTAIGASQLHDLVVVYLATQRATRDLVRSARVTGKPISFTINVGSILPPVQLPQGDLRFAALTTRVVITVLGVAALAAASWTTAQVAGQRIELDRDAARMAQQARIASELAAFQIANGMPVNVPDVVRALGEKELRSLQWGPWLVGGVALLGAAGVGAYAARGRRAS